MEESGDTFVDNFEAQAQTSALREFIFKSVKPSIETAEAAMLFNSFGYKVDNGTAAGGDDANVYKNKKLTVENATAAELGTEFNEEGGPDQEKEAAAKKATLAAKAKPSAFNFDINSHLLSNTRSDLSTHDKSSALDIMNKHPDLRTQAEIEKVGLFLKGFPFFSQFSEKLNNHIAKVCRLQQYNFDSIIYDEGEMIDSVFVVLKGAVGIRVKNPSRSGSFFYQSILKKGDSFGDASLNPKDGDASSVRALCHITLEDTDLVQLTYKEYRKILDDIFSRDFLLKVNFCKEATFLQNCTLREIQKLANALQIVECPRNSIIFKQGAPSDFVYFTHTGSVRIIQNCKIPIVKSVKVGNPFEEQDIEAVDEAKEVNVNDEGRAERAVLRDRGSYRVELLELGVVQSNWFFGELGVLTNMTRSAFAYAVTDCVLLKISREDFFNCTPSNVLMFMQEYCELFYKSPDRVVTDVQNQLRWKEFKTNFRKVMKKHL